MMEKMAVQNQDDGQKDNKKTTAAQRRDGSAYLFPDFPEKPFTGFSDGKRETNADKPETPSHAQQPGGAGAHTAAASAADVSALNRADKPESVTDAERPAPPEEELPDPPETADTDEPDGMDGADGTEQDAAYVEVPMDVNVPYRVLRPANLTEQNVEDSPYAAPSTPADGEEQPDAEEEESGAKSAGRGWRRLVYTLSITVVSVLLALFILSVFADRYGIGKSSDKVDVTIPSGAGAQQVAEVLKENGVISNTLAFRLFVRQNHVSGFQSGVFSVTPSDGYESVISVLTNPDNNKNNVVVQITEGQTITQIAATLETKGICSAQDFLNTLDSGDFSFSLSSQISDSDSRYYKYEGYLFPDSYTLLKNSSGKAAVQKMLSNFTSKFTSEMQEKATAHGMSVDQVITLASIVQKEADTSVNRLDTMKHVASVFYNRLNTGVSGKKLLQSDATILYAKRDLTGTLDSSDAALASPYNTYRYEGLPPGPICNPGLDAIDAVLDPAQSDDFYFVSDVNGNYYFAANYKTHLKNIKTAAKNGGTKATGDLTSSSSSSSKSSASSSKSSSSASSKSTSSSKSK